MSATLALLVLLTAPPHEPNPFLLQAKVLQQSLEFEKCLKRLDNAGKWKETTDAERAEIELYFGLCKLGLGREREAEQHIERALKLNPALTLPPLSGPRVEKVFENARARAGVAAPTPAAEPDLPPAATPALVPDAPPPSPPPVVEAKPVRLGPPIALAAVSAASLAAALVLGAQAQSVAAESRGAGFASDAVSLGQQANTFALGANVLYAVAGAALVACIVLLIALN